MTFDVTSQKNKNAQSKKNLEDNEKGKQIKDFIKNLSEEQKMKFWIKTLLSSQKTFPEIIKTLDRIIELQASSVSFASSIYNLENPTFKQVEKVIDLSERKTFLLNIYLMSKELTKGLSLADSEFLEKKFVYNLSVETLAKEFDISPRTVYRKTNKLIEHFEYFFGVTVILCEDNRLTDFLPVIYSDTVCHKHIQNFNYCIFIENPLVECR